MYKPLETDSARTPEPSIAVDSPWMTTVEAAAYCRSTREAIKKQVARGKLTPDAWGGRGGLKGHRFTRETLDKFMRRAGGR